jgi:hypothetical protein
MHRTVFHLSTRRSLAFHQGRSAPYTYVGHVLTETTRRELGVAINPHLFRECGVYIVATHAGERIGIARGLLQHADPRSTEKNYNKDAMFTAAARYPQTVDELT